MTNYQEAIAPQYDKIETSVDDDCFVNMPMAINIDKLRLICY